MHRRQFSERECIQMAVRITHKQSYPPMINIHIIKLLSNYNFLLSRHQQIDVSSAMEYLHSLRPCIIHRDLKSHNVLQSYQGTLKICDFGLVSVRNAQAGTPAYMAPELIQNR